MSQLLQRFAQVQDAVAAYTRNSPWRDNYLHVSEINGFIHVNYYASPFESFFNDLLDILCHDDVAPRLQLMHFHAHDHGGNGTRHWNFAQIVDSHAVFPNLTQLTIEPYDNLAHNHPIVCYSEGSYDESGTLAKWLTKAPGLKSLTTPSAPNSDFFKREPCALEVMNIQAGYDTQGFILNLSQSQCFPKLRHFEYRDYDETYMDDFRQHCTPFEHFQALFQSPAFDPVKSFVWHNPIFSVDELSKLKTLRPELSFKVARVSSEWVK